MPTQRQRPRGFSLVELMVGVAIVGLLAGLAAFSMSRGRPRADLATASGEVQAILHQARISALAAGHRVVVLVFPEYVAGTGQAGRLVVIEDQASRLFVDGATPNLEDYDAGVPAFGAPASQQPLVYDLPPGVVFVAGRTSGPLPAPFSSVPTSTACTFCDALTKRGAIAFDERGRATFHATNGAALSVTSGASLTLGSTQAEGVRTLVVTSGTGAVIGFSDK